MHARASRGIQGRRDALAGREPPEDVRELRRVQRAIRRVLRQAGLHDGIERPTDVGREDLGGQPRRRRGDLFHQQLRDARRLEREPPGDHLVEHDPDGIDVRPVVDRFALRLLG